MQTPQTLRAIARQTIDDALVRIARFSGIELPPVQVDFSLRGRCAGQAGLRGGKLWLRINLPVMANHLDDYLSTTIPHEIAHLHILWTTRTKRYRPRPHGPEWQGLMRNCFCLEPQRCHDYQTSPARVVTRNHNYHCGCREHRLTSIMHNRIRKGVVLICRSCRQPLMISTTLP